MAKEEKEKTRRAKGDGGLFQRADGVWQATLDMGYGPDGNRKRWIGRSKTFDGAMAKLRDARKELGNSGDIASKTLTVGQWLDRWLTEIVKPNTKPRTHYSYAALVRREITPRVGRVVIASLTPAHVRGMLADIAKDGRISTARGAHRVLRAALNDAAAEGLVQRNVASLVTPPKSIAVDRESLTVNEAKTLLKSSACHRLGSRWGFALFTGTRQGEGLGLTWDRVDLKAQTVDISWQLQRLPYAHGCTPTKTGHSCGRVRGGSCPKRFLPFPHSFENKILEGGVVLTRPKTNKGTRVIPMPSALTEMLKQQRLDSFGEPNPHNLVWHNPDGSPIDPPRDSGAWHRALETAGVKSVPLHSARHTTATLLMELKVDPMVIKTILGHSEIATTQGYLHVDLSLAREAMDRLGEELG